MDYRGRGRFNRGGGGRGGRGGFMGRGGGGGQGRQLNPTKLHVSNIPEGCTCKDLEELFDGYGKVVECDIVKDFAFVHYSNAEEAKQAVENLDGHSWMGTTLAVKHSTSGLRQKPGASSGDCFKCGGRGHSSSECFSDNSGGYGGGGGGRFPPRPSPYGDPYAGGRGRGRGAFRRDFGGRNNFGGEGRGGARGGRQLNPTKLHVAGFPESSSSQDLEQLFETFGKVVECDIVKNFAFVHFRNADDAEKAVENLDGEEWRGSKLSVRHSTSGLRQKPGASSGDCFICGGRGHSSTECPSENQGGRGGRGGMEGMGGMGMPYGGPYGDPYRHPRFMRDPYADMVDPYARMDPYRAFAGRGQLYDPLLEGLTVRDLALLRADALAARDPYARPPPEFYQRRRVTNGSSATELGDAGHGEGVEQSAVTNPVDDSYFYNDDYGSFSASL